MSKSAIREVTAAEAGLSGDDQMTIALREIVRRGGQAQVWEIYEAVEEELGGCFLSHQGKASLRRIVNTDAVEAGYLYPPDPWEPGWRITPQGRQLLKSLSNQPNERPDAETISEERPSMPRMEGLEMHYDRHGNPKSVVLPYADYKDLAAVQEENKALKHKLRKIHAIVSGTLEPQKPAPYPATGEDGLDAEGEATYWSTPVKPTPEQLNAQHSSADPRRVFCAIDEDYTGRSIMAFRFEGRTQEVITWREAATELFALLYTRNPKDFERRALTIAGRKRRYFAHNESELSDPVQVPNTDLFFEGNLSANLAVRLCCTVIQKMGFDTSALSFKSKK